jgi:aquaporin Z
MKALITEFIGTFFLVLTIGLSIASGTAVAPLAIGSALMVMVFMGGHVSGAHYNPAVSLAVFLRGKFPGRDLLSYWGAQILGALAAAGCVYYLAGRALEVAPATSATVGQALLAEFLYTFALASVVLNVATAKGTAGNSFYGLAIGFTVMVGAFSVGGISGGAFNPAVGIGPIVMAAIVTGGSFQHLWLYIVGPLAGGAAAAFVFKFQHGTAED